MKENLPVRGSEDEGAQFMKNSVLYKEFLAEREEILKHKWIESEKAGADIGFEKALLDWIVGLQAPSWYRPGNMNAQRVGIQRTI